MRRALFLLIAATALVPASAHAAAPPGTAAAQSAVVTKTYKLGPIPIGPGQNDPRIEPLSLKPDVPGWIVGFRPNLELRGGEIPLVDDIHLHHAVWLVNGRLTFPTGEEKTQIHSPAGYGWRHETGDAWALAHMIHNLTPTPTEVWITWEIDFIPDSSPAAAGMRAVQTQWMDVVGGGYPVFDVLQGSGGRDRRYTFPTDDRARMRSGYANHRWTVQEDGVLVGTVGHMHPGGLHTDLFLERDGRKVRLFRSRMKYWDPNGPVSWDMAARATPVDWRAGVRKGDVLSITATYETRRASWYESMGIMPVAFAPGQPGPDPFTVNVERPGAVTHGRLPENRHKGGEPAGLPNPLQLLSQPAPPGGVRVSNFVYGHGDLQAVGRRGRPPAIRRGQSLRFFNRDARRGILHTITSCKAPCNRAAGISYPLATARFDSGNLGFGSPDLSPAANRDNWRTPRSLRPGTYAYFCRVHPFMRGAFRVKH